MKAAFEFIIGLVATTLILPWVVVGLGIYIDFIKSVLK